MWISKDELNRAKVLCQKGSQGALSKDEIKSLPLEFEKLKEILGYFSDVLIRERSATDALKLASEGAYSSIYFENANSDLNREILYLVDVFKDIEKITYAISEGDYSLEIREKSKKDRLARSINTILYVLKDVVYKLDRISTGDFSVEFESHKKNDKLANALLKMTKYLKDSEIMSKKIDWTKSNLNALSTKLSGDRDKFELSSKALNFIAQTLDCGRGALYLRKEDRLILCASYACFEMERKSLGFGEGLVGECVKSKRDIILKKPKNRSILIGSRSESSELYCAFPLIYEDNIYGALELDFLYELDKWESSFLSEACVVIASYLFAAEGKEEINRLLSLSEESNQKLQVQSEELQQTNAQLEEQQQQLQQQSEELQQTNAQLEELQQQLQQQLEELQVNNDELTKSRYELDVKNKELQKANLYKSQFLANVSHELRTPLNSIILLSKILALNENGKLSDSEIKKASVIYDSGNELLRLINDILDLSKIEATATVFNISKFHSKEIFGHLKDMFEPQAREKGLNLTLVDEYNGIIESDRDKFLQILRNITQNAIKFTKSGGVWIRFLNMDRELKIEIEDSGIGIPSDKRETIFEPFQQLDGSISREFGGTGLGLAIVKEFALALNISLELESEMQKGSKFILKVPNRVKKELLENIEVESLDPTVKYVFVLSKDIDRSRKIDEIVSLKLNKHKIKIVIKSKIDELHKIIKIALPQAIIIDNIEIEQGAVLQEIKGARELQDIPLLTLATKELESRLYEFCDMLLSRKESIAIYPRLDNDISYALKSSGATIVTFEELNLFLDYISQNRPSKVIVTLKDLDVIKRIKQKSESANILILLDKNLTQEEENRLKPFISAIIIKSELSKQRLLDELNRSMENNSISSQISDVKLNLVSDVKLDNKKILIVDDDIKNIYVLSSIFESKGAVVAQAFDGAMALEKLKDGGANLVLMDIMMPNMDGYEAIKKIRDSEYSKVPIIVVSAKALKEDKTKAIELGANDYISKPLDYNALVSMCAAWIEKSTNNM